MHVLSDQSSYNSTLQVTQIASDELSAFLEPLIICLVPLIQRIRFSGHFTDHLLSLQAPLDHIDSSDDLGRLFHDPLFPLVHIVCRVDRITRLKTPCQCGSHFILHSVQPFFDFVLVLDCLLEIDSFAFTREHGTRIICSFVDV